MNNKYAIFSDVDGTIYTREKEIHSNLIEKILKAQKKGIEFIFCTGNPYMKNMKDLSKKFNINYFIGSNGAVIIDVKNNKFISSKKISKDLAQNILDIALKYDCSSNWFDEYELFVSPNTSNTIKQMLIEMVLTDKEPIIATKVMKDINKIEFYGNEKKIDLVEKELKKHHYTFARIKHNHIEITAKDVSKGHALKELSNYLNIPLKNTMAIGDSTNDHSMLKVAGYSYAMANGCDKTKKIASYHTSCVTQNGLGNAIIDFMFRNRLTSNFDGQESNLPKNK